MDDFVTARMMVVFLFAGGVVISEGQNTTDNYYQELLNGTQAISTLGPENVVSTSQVFFKY